MEENGKKKQMDYKNGQIYKLISDHTDKIYIGSTCWGLRKRLCDHKTKYKMFCSGKYHNVTSFELFKLGNVDIVLIENYQCKDKNELHSRERYWIEQNKPLVFNRIIPARSRKEFREENREMIKISKAKYYEQNKKRIKQKSTKYYNQKMEVIRARNKRPYFCTCGRKINHAEISRHLKTKSHQQYEHRMNQFKEITELHNKTKSLCEKSFERFKQFMSLF